MQVGLLRTKGGDIGKLLLGVHRTQPPLRPVMLRQRLSACEEPSAGSCNCLHARDRRCSLEHGTFGS